MSSAMVARFSPLRSVRKTTGTMDWVERDYPTKPTPMNSTETAASSTASSSPPTMRLNHSLLGTTTTPPTLPPVHDEVEVHLHDVSAAQLLHPMASAINLSHASNPGVAISQLEEEQLVDRSTALTSGLDYFRVAIRMRPLPTPQHADNVSPFTLGGGGLMTLPSAQNRIRRRFSQPFKEDSHNNDNSLAWNITTASTHGISSPEQSQPVLVQADASRPVSGRNMFSFDHIFHGQQCTEEVYHTVAKPIVEQVMAGRHGTIFAYGQTGSGKTYTMQGASSTSNGVIEVQSLGIVQLATRDILEFVQRQQQKETQRNNHQQQLRMPHQEYKLSAQFFEVYNEQVRDLLVDGDMPSPSRLRSGASTCSSKGDISLITIRDDRGPNGTTMVTVNAHSEYIREWADIESILSRGNRNRACASTAMNTRSSRSHAIFRLTLERCWPPSSTGLISNQPRTQQSVLNLVDLAGSENSSQSGVTGMRKKEAGKINQRVIHSLSLPPKKRPKHINFRDSKLTRIMQPHLSGNACLAVLCCISPARIHVEETRSTLKFADNAKRIKVQPLVNQLLNEESKIEVLMKELQEAKLALLELQQRYELVQNSVPITPQSSGSLFGGVCVEPNSVLGESSKNRNVKVSHVMPFGDKVEGPSEGYSPVECESDAFLVGQHSVSQTLDKGNIQDGDADAEPTLHGNESFDHLTALPHDVVINCTGSYDDEDITDHDFTENNDHFSLRSSFQKRLPPCDEVVVLADHFSFCSKDTDARLAVAEERVAFLTQKLEGTYDSVDAIYKTLQIIQRKNVDLELRNRELELSLLNGDENPSGSEDMEGLREEVVIFKFAATVGVIFYLSGQKEFLFFVLAIFLVACRADGLEGTAKTCNRIRHLTNNV